MNKKKYVIEASIILIVVIGTIWLRSPVQFLKNTDANEISRIEVFDRHNGKQFIITNQEDIAFIVSNIQSTNMKREKVSIGYMGTHFSMQFYNLDGKKIDEFILNAADTIRKDSFFYIDEMESLCINYLQAIEDGNVKETYPRQIEADNTERVSSITLLTAAPEIVLTDSFSSQMNKFSVLSGQYTWSYLDGEETVTISACGAHPLDIVQTKQEGLEVPKYNKIDYVPYMLSSVVMPNEITVNEWDVAQLGNTDESVLSTKIYTNESLIELKPDRVYEIIAQWDEKNFETRGFYGEASYVVITQEK